MNCPKCGNEMRCGFLQAGNIVAFNQRRHKVFLTAQNPEDTLITHRMWTAADFEGFICKKCGLVVFDYQNPITRW